LGSPISSVQSSSRSIPDVIKLGQGRLCRQRPGLKFEVHE
jgi:hypothetical protein